MEELKTHINLKLQGALESCETTQSENKKIQIAIAKEFKMKQKEAQTEVGEMLTRSQDVVNTGLAEQNKRARAWDDKVVTTSAAIKTVTASTLNRLQDHPKHFESALAQWRAQEG